MLYALQYPGESEEPIQMSKMWAGRQVETWRSMESEQCGLK